MKTENTVLHGQGADTMIEWTTDLPTRAGRYFVRPIKKGLGRTRGYVVTVSEFGGDLVAWAGPDLYEYFRMAALDRVHMFLNEPGLEWGYIDDVTDWDWNHAPEPSEQNAGGGENAP